MKQKKIFFIYLFILIIVLVILFYSYTQKVDKSIKMREVANTSLTVVKFLSKGASIDYGPKEVTNKIRSKYPAIFEDMNQTDIYFMIVSYDINGIYLVMNSTQVIKEVQINNLAFN